MKRNKTMRLASVLAVAVLMSTCMISGTFAKYVTGGEAADTARVAKWGMTVLASGSLFGENYVPNSADASKDEISAGALQSVDTSVATENIVAPGTKNSTGLTLAVKGTPEVAFSVLYENQDTPNETIWLNAGHYAVLVETDRVTADNFAGYYYNDGGTYKLADGSETFADLGSDWYEIHDITEVTENEAGDGKYYPILWTVSKNGTTGTLDTATYRDIADVETALEGEFTAATNNPNVLLDDSYTITWAWDFTGQQDGADTILGNLMAAGDNYVVVESADDTYATASAVAAEDYNLDVAFGAKLTVTQID